MRFYIDSWSKKSKHNTSVKHTLKTTTCISVARSDNPNYLIDKR